MSRILEKKEGKYAKTLAKIGSQQFSYSRYGEELFPYRDLYGVAMLVPIRMGTDMAAEENLSLCFATKA